MPLGLIEMGGSISSGVSHSRQGKVLVVPEVMDRVYWLGVWDGMERFGHQGRRFVA